MRKLASLLLLLVALISPRPALAEDARAQELLKQARIAIGGEGLLQKVERLGFKGEYRRIFGQREMGGDREVSIQLPDKYLVEDAMNMGGMSTAIVMTKGLNAERAWNASSGGGGGSMIFRSGGGAAGAEATPEQIEAGLRRLYRNEFTRYLLAILATPPSSFPLEYKYAGESTVEDAPAEVIEITGPDKFAVRIFFDRQTHLPLLLSYRANKPRIMTSTTMSPGKNVKPEDAAKHAKAEVDKKLAGEPMPKPEEVDFFLRVTEYKKVGGLLLPHKLTFLTEEVVSEEFQISKYELNPQFKPDRFQKN